MLNNGNGELHLGDNSFIGVNPFWLILVLVLLFFTVVLFSRYRKRR